MVWIGSKSPITYDSNAALAVMCLAGQVEVRLIERTGPGIPDLSKGTLLACKTETADSVAQHQTSLPTN